MLWAKFCWLIGQTKVAQIQRQQNGSNKLINFSCTEKPNELKTREFGGLKHPLNSSGTSATENNGKIPILLNFNRREST